MRVDSVAYAPATETNNQIINIQMTSRMELSLPKLVDSGCSLLCALKFWQVIELPNERTSGRFSIFNMLHVLMATCCSASHHHAKVLTFT